MTAHRRAVVGAALVRDGRVLAARRSAPAELAGGWEFPGGKVEPGETDAAALRRECLEELGVTVTVGALLGTAPISPDLVLRLYAAQLRRGEPTARQDHDELQWLAAAALESVRWLDVDLALLPAVRRLLTGRAT
jgi:8-oxo-dGTP diphosphatase